MLGFMSHRLSTQKKMDYCPKNDDVFFAQLNTEPCLAIVDALDAFHQEAQRTLTERTRESLCTELGVGLHAMLCEHLKKFTVSATGGLMLTKDLAMYQDACAKFGVPLVNDRFEMLRQLGTLFIVQPGVLKSFMREGHLSCVDEALLRPYLHRRQDYARELRALDEGGTPSTPDDASMQGSSLLASFSQHTGLSSAWSLDKKTEYPRDVPVFVTDVPEIGSLMEQLLHPPPERPSSARSMGAGDTPSRSSTPQSHMHATGSPRTDSPSLLDSMSRSPSPAKTSRRDRLGPSF